MTTEEATKEREELLSLASNPGWLIVIRYWKGQWGKDAYIAKLKGAEKPEDVKTITQVFEALEELVTYPDRRIQELQKQMEPKTYNPSRRGGL